MDIALQIFMWDRERVGAAARAAAHAAARRWRRRFVVRGRRAERPSNAFVIFEFHRPSRSADEEAALSARVERGGGEERADRAVGEA